MAEKPVPGPALDASKAWETSPALRARRLQEERRRATEAAPEPKPLWPFGKRAPKSKP